MYLTGELRGGSQAALFSSMGILLGLFLLLAATRLLVDLTPPPGLPEGVAPIIKEDPKPYPPLAEPIPTESEIPDLPLEPLPATNPPLASITVHIEPGKPTFPSEAGVPTGFGADPRILTFDTSQLDRIPGVIKRGRLIYPHEMKREHIEGFVELKILINERGRVRVIEVLHASHRGFVDSAITAAENSVFEAPLKDKKPVRATYILPIRFGLPRARPH